MTDYSSDGDSSSTPTYYDYQQYQDVLDNADLEQNNTTIKTAGKFASYDISDFYIDESRFWLTFKAEGENNNYQLLVMLDFKNSDSHY